MNTTAQLTEAKFIRDHIYEWAEMRDQFTIADLLPYFVQEYKVLYHHVRTLVKAGRVERVRPNVGKIVYFRIVSPHRQRQHKEQAIGPVDVTPETVAQLLRRLGPRESVHIAAYIDDRVKGTDTLSEVRKVLFGNPHLFFCRRDAWGLRQP